QVEAIRGPLLEGLGSVVPRAGQVPFYSAVTTGQADAAGLDAEYWYRNLRQQVRFHETVAALAAAGHRVFVEISPHPVLVGAIEDTLAAGPADPAAVIGTLRRGQGGAERMLLS